MLQICGFTSTVSKTGDLNLVLLGRSGVGKSSCGNTILGRQIFKPRPPSSSEPVTLKPQIASGMVAGRNVAVIDTPDLFGSQISHEKLQKQILSIVPQTSPRLCVFLAVLLPADVVHNLEETLVAIRAAFGEKARDCTLALITHGDHKETTVENFPEAVRQKMHIFDNTKSQDSKQARELLSKIARLIQKTDGFHLSQPLRTTPAVVPKPRTKFVHLPEPKTEQRQELGEKKESESAETQPQLSSKLIKCKDLFVSDKVLHSF